MSSAQGAMSSPGVKTPGRGFLGFGSPWASPGGSSRVPRSPRITLDPSAHSAETVSKLPASYDATLGLVDKFNLDSIITAADPEEMVTSFVVTVDPDNAELELEQQETIDCTVRVSQMILHETAKAMRDVLPRVIASTIYYNIPGDDPDAPSQKMTVESRAKMAVAETVIDNVVEKLPQMLQDQHQVVFQEYYVPHLSAALERTAKKTKDQCLVKLYELEKAIKSQLAEKSEQVSQLADKLSALHDTRQLSHSDMSGDTTIIESAAEKVFNTCMMEVKLMYNEWRQVKAQHDTEMSAVAMCSNELATAVDADAKDQLIAAFTGKQVRAKALKTIMDFKFEAVIQTIYSHYPDIAGSASSANSKKGYALHDYRLPAGILGSKHDAKIASEMLAGLIQIAQAWVEDFWLVLIFLKRIQDNESPFEPVYAPTVAQFKEMLGDELGSVLETQMGKMWSVVSRGNQDIVEFNRNNPSVSMFAQITTGGNGEPERKSTVEPKNIISFVCYIVHHHDQGLSDRRRQMTAVMKHAYALLSDGCIVKACEMLQKHWAEAMSLKVKVDWYSLIHLGSDILRHRSTDFWDKMTSWINCDDKQRFVDDCLPKISEWIADILAIALRLTNTSPRKYVTHEITAAKASMQAYSDVLGGKTPVQSKHVDTTAKSSWKCGNKDCKEHIPQAIVTAFLQRREKKGDNSKKAPEVQALLCSACHDKHSKGQDIILSDGSVKRHFQKRDDSTGDSADERRKAKNKEKNARRKARKAEAKLAASAAEPSKTTDAASTPSKPENAQTDSETNLLLRKVAESMDALPSKLAAMAMAHAVKPVAAHENPTVEQFQSEGVDEQATSVVKHMLGAYERAKAQTDVKASPAKMC